MPTIKPMLVGTDLSWYARRAEMRAAMLAAESNVELLELLHVVGGAGLESLRHLLTQQPHETERQLLETATEQLEKQARGLAEEFRVAVKPIVEIGRPYAVIAQRATALDAALVVLGAHGGGFVRELFIGSTAEKVARKQSRPTLIVKREPRGPYGSVLVPLDFSESSRRAVESALRIAPQARVSLLHAFEVPFEGRMRSSGVRDEIIHAYRAEAREQATHAMRRLVSDLGDAGRISQCVEFGYAPTVIRERAEVLDPDLIVMGKHGTAEWEEMLLGSVTKHVMREADCDVLVVS